LEAVSGQIIHRRKPVRKQCEHIFGKDM